MDENKILDLLEKIYVEVQETKIEVKNHTGRLDRIEKKLDSVVEQTADLTEFRTETKSQLQKIHSDLTAVEIVTSKNWNDIATLKIVK